MRQPTEALAIHGVRLQLTTDGSESAEACARELREDFAAWTGVDPVLTRPGLVELRLHGTAGLRRGRARALFHTKMAAAHGFGSAREIDYGNGSLARLEAVDADRIVASVHSPDPLLLREIAYVATLALIGELLDLRGLHRVHALGFEHAGRGVLCVLGQAAGKSTLTNALRRLASPQLKFHSDETPLLKGTLLVAYPNRIALTPRALRFFNGRPDEGRVFRRRIYGEKRLFAWRHGELARAVPIGTIFLDGGRESGSPGFEPVSRARTLFALTDSMVVGRGVAQMAEFLLRADPGQLCRLGLVAAGRARTAVAVACGAQGFLFRRTSDPERNARALLDFLGS